MEAMIALALTGGLLLSTLLILRPAADLSSLVQERSELQQNSRVAVNSIARELSISGTGIPLGGIQLPAGDDADPSRFACTFGECYLSASDYDSQRLYSVTPGSARGPAAAAQSTDVVTLMYRDDLSQLDQYPLVQVNPSGLYVEVDSRTSPGVHDQRAGIQVGDVLLLSNVNGCAAAVVTSINGNVLVLTDGDPLGFNQSSAEYGNVKSLANPGTTGVFPPTRAFRVHVVTYYLDFSNQANPRLMRQDSAHRAEPVAENIEDLQITYDIFEDNTATASSNLDNAANKPNQIRKINLFVAARSPRERLFSRGFDRDSLRTSVSARNLAFRDRYE